MDKEHYIISLVVYTFVYWLVITRMCHLC